MALGCIIGYVLTMYLIKTCELDITMFSPKISIYSYVYSLLITLGFTILVNIATYFALKKIDMDQLYFDMWLAQCNLYH